MQDLKNHNRNLHLLKKWMSDYGKRLMKECDSTDFLHSLNKEKPFWHRILTTWYPSHPEIVSQLIQENVIQVSKEWLAQFLFVQHKGSILNETCQMLLSKGEDSLEGCTAHATLLELSNLSRLQLVTPKVQKKLSTKDVKPEIGTETDQENDLKIEEIPGALTQKPELKKDGKPKGKRVRVLKSLEDWSCWWSDDELDSAHFMWEQWSDDSLGGSDSDDSADSNASSSSSDNSRKDKDEESDTNQKEEIIKEL